MTIAELGAIPPPTDLLGEWRLDRRAADYRAGRFGTVRGTLQLRPVGDQIHWIEAGRLCFAGRQAPVSREYRLQLQPEGWWVLFPDGRPFHPWRPGEWVRHRCGADEYRGLIAVAGDRAWRTLWDVRGPDKTQRILTRLTPAGGPSGRR